MKENEPMLTRGECEKCGAPLARGAHRGEYVCHYCGAVYYDKQETARHWDEEVEKPKPAPQEKPRIAAAPAAHTHKKTGNIFLIVGVCITILLCLGAVLFASINSDPSPREADTDLTDDKPDMLAALPQAVRAGTPVPFEGWELTFNPELSTDNNKISFSFSLKNWHDSHQTFSYQTQTIVVYDNIGNTYPLYLGNCEPDFPYLDRQITFQPYEEINFQSSTSWCGRENRMPVFFGVIPLNADNLYFHFETFGVYRNITFVFDL